ncbi:MAG: hypothetical protein GXO15_05495 [Crenarchaeota archaeon]|nr:hypothetical protein [Thermoproteota archaeon]
MAAASGGCVALDAGEGLWVAGPARVEVVEGCVSVVGFEACSGDVLVVGGARGATFVASGGRARVCIVAGSGAAYTRVPSGRVFEAWSSLVEKLEAEGASRIVVVGGMETGKSTLVTWLHNVLGLGVVEADVGQNELGLPACVAYSSDSRRAVALSDLEPSGCLFVGHVSAEKVMDLVVSAAVASARRLRGGFVVDTDGFVAGRGVYYKAALAAALEADAVVVMGSAPALSAALRALGLRVYEAPAPELPRERSRLDRRSFRQRMWSRLFSDAETVVLDGVPILGLCPASREGDATVYHCPRATLTVAARAPPRGGGLRPGWEKGLLAAIAEGGTHTPALVERIVDPVEGRVVVRASKRPASTEGLILGWVLIHSDYSEEHLPTGLHPETVLQRRTGRQQRRGQRPRPA